MNHIYQLVDNRAAKQYEFHISGKIAKIEYIRAQNRIFLAHTEVPKGLEGMGVGKNIVKQVLEDVEKHNLILIPLCPFVAMYIKRNPIWKKLVLKGINIK